MQGDGSLALALRPAHELRRLLLDREISVAELIEACHDRITRLNPLINAVVTLNEHAIDDARELDARLARGEAPGPLFGLPVGIKDVTPVAGLRTTYGSPLYRDHVPEQDALIVRRVREAGGIIIGKTNTPEFATGGNTYNDVFGRTRNPWDPSRSAGGSTGGGAAGLATGMIAFAEGTDLGGSLRIPASFCGIVGLRPSPGLVPTWPSDWAWDTLQVTGCMARTAHDVALMLDAVSGPDAVAPLRTDAGDGLIAAVEAGPGSGLRIAWCPDIAGIGIDPAIERVCRDAAFELEHAGAHVEEKEFDLSEGRKAFLALRGYWMLAHQFTRLDHLDAFGPNLAANIRAGLETTTLQLGEAEHIRGRIRDRFLDLFQRFDYLLTPCMAIAPFPVEQNYPDAIAGRPMASYIDWVAPTFVLSLTGLPVASVPCGLDDGGLPVGLQIVGRPAGDGAVLALAATIQAMRPIGVPAAA